LSGHFRGAIVVTVREVMTINFHSKFLLLEERLEKIQKFDAIFGVFA
jgi:hypothetical protein